MTGVTFNNYYGSLLIFNLVIFLFTHAVVMISAYAFKVSSLYIPPAFATYSLFFIVVGPGLLMFTACVSFIFDRSESAKQYFSSMISIMILSSYMPTAIVEMIVPESPAGSILNYVFTIILPFYLPPGIMWQLSKIYIKCSLLDTCDSMSSSDYCTPEIITMYVMAIVNIPMYYMLLRILDAKKNGGSFRKALFLKVRLYLDFMEYCKLLNSFLELY